jgi:cytochrome c biogenesis protein CcmG, thiol:disulfide interchange protein DsbE
MKKSTKIWLIVLGILALTCVICVGSLAWTYTNAINTAQKDRELFPQTVKVGAPAPDFSLPSLDGGTIALSDFKGKPLVLSIGASWCPDCAKELPILAGLKQKYADLSIVWIDSREDPKIVQKFVDQNEITYPVGLDKDGKFSNQFHVYAIPTVLFIDSAGVIQAVFIEVLPDADVQSALQKIGVK